MPQPKTKRLVTEQSFETIASKFLESSYTQAFCVPAPSADGTVNRINIQATINAAAAAGGGVVEFRNREYVINGTVTLPNGIYVWLRGAGFGQVNNTYGTRLRRLSGNTPLIQALGALENRPRFTISDMAINGGGGSTVLHLSRPSGSNLRNLFINSAAGTLLLAEEWWNCAITNVSFMTGGTGRDIPTVWFKAPVTDGQKDPGNTIQMTGCLWEGNTGTELRLSGADDGVLALLVSNFKMERNIGNYPMIDLEKAGACQFGEGFMHLGPNATAPHIENRGSTVPSRPNAFSNVELSANKWTVGGAAGGGAVIPYFIDVVAGELLLSNISMNGEPTNSYIHIGPSVALDAVKLNNIYATSPAKMLHEERPFSTLQYGTVEVPARVVQTGTTTIVPSISADQVIYRMAQSVKSDYAGQITVPSDAAPNRPIRVRVRWYSPGTAGAVRIEAKAKPGMSGGSRTIVAAAETQTAVVTVPAIANEIVQTTFTFAATAGAGQVVPITFSRVGNDASDTLTGFDIRILQVEMRYERSF